MCKTSFCLYGLIVRILGDTEYCFSSENSCVHGKTLTILYIHTDLTNFFLLCLMIPNDREEDVGKFTSLLESIS